VSIFSMWNRLLSASRQRVCSESRSATRQRESGMCERVQGDGHQAVPEDVLFYSISRRSANVTEASGLHTAVEHVCTFVCSLCNSICIMYSFGYYMETTLLTSSVKKLQNANPYVAHELFIPTGDAEGRGAHADLPERHVPQQARVQKQNRPGRRQRHGDPLHVRRQCRRQTRVWGETDRCTF